MMMTMVVAMVKVVRTTAAKMMKMNTIMRRRTRMKMKKKMAAKRRQEAERRGLVDSGLG